MFHETKMVETLPNLKKFAMKLTRNSSDAEDLLQATTLRMLEKADLFEDGANLFGWGSKIMFNNFVTAYRRKSQYETQYDPENHINTMVVEADQETRIELKQVARAMQRLSAEHREILLLVCVKGLKYSEVSEILHLPIGTVRSRLSRARESLRIALETRGISHTHQLPLSEEYEALAA